MKTLKKLLSLFGAGGGDKPSPAPAPAPIGPPPASEGAHHIPVYPPTDPGIPFVEVDAVVASQNVLIDKIMKAAALDPESQKFIPELIRNFAAYVHLLPATRAEQYPGNGGLFRMGLEVGFHSLRASHGVIFAREIAEVRVRTIPRWRIATLVAGLLADTYRAVTSMHVITEDGVQWNPFTEPLAVYLERDGSQRYFIKWLKDAQDNQAFNNLVVGAVVPPSLLAYLADTGPQIVGGMLEAIAGTGSTPLSLAVQKTRNNLIKRDVQANPNFIGRPMLGSHLEAHLVDAMRRLVREGKWKANTNGQPLWNGPEGLFLVIQSGWKDIYAGLMSGGFTGIPTDFAIIADILLKAGVIVPAPKGGYIYEIKIPTFEKKGLEAVKLSSGIKAFGDAYQGFERLDVPLLTTSAEANTPAPAPKAPKRQAQPQVQPAPVQEHSAPAQETNPAPQARNVPPTPIYTPPIAKPAPVAPEPEMVEVFEDVDLPDGIVPAPSPQETGELPPDVSDLLASMEDGWEEAGQSQPAIKALGKDGARAEEPQGDTSSAELIPTAGVLNSGAWSRYSAKMSPEVAKWIGGVLQGVIAGTTPFVVMSDAYGVPASQIDDAGLGRGNVLNIMVRDGLIWMPPGQQKKLVDMNGVAHVFFNRRFWDEVTTK